jgi:transcriptional regulator with XRE-family HTH domain
MPQWHGFLDVPLEDIRRLRLNRSLSQENVCRLLLFHYGITVTQPTLSRYEKGARAMPLEIYFALIMLYGFRLEINRAAS